MKNHELTTAKQFLLSENVNPMNEMAKIQGDLKTAIEKVINDNPEVSGLALKKMIKSDPAVVAALEVPGDIPQTIYDNQLNKFIALTRGDRTLQQRGRKPLDTPSEPESNTSPQVTDDTEEDEWDVPEIEPDMLGGEEEFDPVTDNSNNFKNIIVKKVNKLELMDPQERASSPDMQALKQFIKKDTVLNSLGKDLIRDLVSPLIR